MVGARAKCLSPMLAGLVTVLVVLVVQELPVVVVLEFEVVQVSGEESGRKNHEATEAHCNNRRDQNFENERVRKERILDNTEKIGCTIRTRVLEQRY